MKKHYYEAPQLSSALIEVENGIAVSTPTVDPGFFFEMELEDGAATDYGTF